jgi:hypothetical protein
MSVASEHGKPRLAKIIENVVLLMLAVPPFMILGWQMPRWAQGLDPTFMHPNFLAWSSYPSVLRLAAVHPVIWMLALLAITVRLCRNYGWSHVGITGSRNTNMLVVLTPAPLPLHRSRTPWRRDENDTMAEARIHKVMLWAIVISTAVFLGASAAARVVEHSTGQFPFRILRLYEIACFVGIIASFIAVVLAVFSFLGGPLPSGARRYPLISFLVGLSFLLVFFIAPAARSLHVRAQTPGPWLTEGLQDTE